MIKLAILTSKGGTGKTTTAINLAHGLSLAGNRVLLVDCDPQGSASAAFGVNGDRGLVDLLIDDKVDIFQVRPRLYLVPSGKKRLADLEMAMAGMDKRSERLKMALSRFAGSDWIILDCSPSINIINLNALGFADYLLIPASLDYFSIEGVKSTVNLAREVNMNGQGKLEILGILPTFYDKRTIISKLALEALREAYGSIVFETEIRFNAEIKKSQWFKKTIFEYAPFSYGAYDYFRLAKEIYQRLGLKSV